MRYGSICSGIEAATVAWKSLGFDPAWFSEIEPFPCQLLKQKYPDIPNHGDMTTLRDKILSGVVEAPDIVCGGTPCQAFSVAGRRESLDDARGNLTLEFCNIVDSIDEVRIKHGKPQTIVFWENVPGVLSTKDNAFGCFLGKLSGTDIPLQTKAGRWSDAGVVVGKKRKIAWRVLDAQCFGLAQRRRRVFVIASAREDFDPSKILFEHKSLSGDSGKGQTQGESSPGFAESSFGAYRPDHAAGTLKASGGVLGGGSETLIIENEKIKCFDISHRSDVVRKCKGSSTLCARMGTGGNNVPIVLMDNGLGVGDEGDPSYTLTKAHSHGVSLEGCVRKLTPVECERLMGFPDNYTKICYNGKAEDKCPDSPRYKALGNSWAVPVVRWLGQRIKNIVNHE